MLIKRFLDKRLDIMEVYTFVAGDTRSSWYKYSDGPLPTLAMRNFSVKKKPKNITGHGGGAVG